MFRRDRHEQFHGKEGRNAKNGLRKSGLPRWSMPCSKHLRWRALGQAAPNTIQKALHRESPAIRFAFARKESCSTSMLG